VLWDPLGGHGNQLLPSFTALLLKVVPAAAQASLAG
jgi:hypothetical protein